MELTHEQSQHIDTLYRQMYPTLYGYALRVLRDKNLADEAVQDTFQIACAKYADLTASPNPQGWIMNVLKYSIQSIQRYYAKFNGFFISVSQLQQEPAAPERSGQDLDAVGEMLLGSEEYRAFRLFALRRISLSEASQLLGISVDACAKRMQRDRVKLQKHLKNL